MTSARTVLVGTPAFLDRIDGVTRCAINRLPPASSAPGPTAAALTPPDVAAAVPATSALAAGLAGEPDLASPEHRDAGPDSLTAVGGTVNRGALSLIAGRLTPSDSYGTSHSFDSSHRSTT